MTPSSPKTIAVWQPYFLGGGAEAVALWLLAALVDDYDVTLCTLAGVDLARLDAMYGTSLAKAPTLTVKHLVPPAYTRLIYALIANLPWAKLAAIHLSIRWFKRVGQAYDLVVSAFNAVDLGKPGLQYLHWINVVEKSRQEAGPVMKLMLRLSQFSEERLKANASVANSHYTAQQVQATYGIQAPVIYPPVVTDLEPVPWDEKEDAFLCSGRVVFAKQTHRVIEILSAVRDRGFNVKLYITGGGGGTYSWGYQNKVRKLAAANSDWVTFYQNLPYADYLEVVARCRYGFHHKPEPFGISVAEMVKAGLIPFVCSRGGQIEIVNATNHDLIFEKANDAVEKIAAVLANPSRQQALLDSLASQAPLFSTEQFAKEIRATVASCLQSQSAIYRPVQNRQSNIQNW
jgi:glycosyltransferase involved in cell wall biosynthesis